MAAVNPIGSFILKHYDVVFAGDGVDTETFENVEEFLLGYEETVTHRDINALFINTHSNKDDLVLMQSDDFTIKLKEREFYKLISTKAKKKGYAAKTKEMHSFAHIKRLMAESSLLQRALHQSEDPKEKYQEAVKIFAVTQLISILNLADEVVKALLKSLNQHHDAIIKTLEKTRSAARYRFLHVDSKVIFSPKSIVTPKFNESEGISPEEVQAYIQKVYPPKLYENFHQRLVNRKIVILTPKFELVQKMEDIRLAAFTEWQKRILHQLQNQDEETLDLLRENEHYQVFSFLSKI
ncbi:MAG: hypothetical protein ACHQUC_00505 [Chlamydiales bacterium]